MRLAAQTAVQDHPPGADDQSATANYIGTIAAELGVLARRNGLDTLGYLLDMARLEAEMISQPAIRKD